MLKPKELLAALAKIPPLALDDFLAETRRKSAAERKAEEARRKQAEADERQANIASLSEVARLAKERERARRMAECPEEVAAEDARMRKIKERLRVNMAALDGTLAASGKPET